jgi:predicted DNA-binding transcriptional regulator YafY
LSICRDLAGNALPEQISERIDDTILRLSMLLNDQSFANRESVQQRQFAFFSKGHIDYTPHYSNIEKLMQAAEERLICLVRYKAAGKTEVKEHRFAPGRMASMSNTLYVLGAGVTEDFRKFRHFTNLAVHRIQDVIVTDKKFVFAIPEAEPNNFGLPWHEPKTFRVSFKPGKAADYVRERIWADQQKLEEQPDGGVILKLTTRSEPEFMAWVRSFGEEANLW